MRTTKQKGTTPAHQDYSWINDNPLPEEIDYNEDGSQFIPIFHVERKLYKLDSHWGTENFKFNLWIGKSGSMFASGSLELVVSYGGRTRKLVGAATLLVPADTDFDTPSVNSNYEATIKSECLKNSVKPIGLSFGQGLNDREAIVAPTAKTPKTAKQKPPAVKMKPDNKIQAQYNKAFENDEGGLLLALNDIYEIQYTGTKQIENVKS